VHHNPKVLLEEAVQDKIVLDLLRWQNENLHEKVMQETR
jgi:hypothetical protein